MRRGARVGWPRSPGSACFGTRLVLCVVAVNASPHGPHHPTSPETLAGAPGPRFALTLGPSTLRAGGEPLRAGTSTQWAANSVAQPTRAIAIGSSRHLGQLAVAHLDVGHVIHVARTDAVARVAGAQFAADVVADHVPVAIGALTQVSLHGVPGQSVRRSLMLRPLHPRSPPQVLEPVRTYGSRQSAAGATRGSRTKNRPRQARPSEASSRHPGCSVQQKKHWRAPRFQASRDSFGNFLGPPTDARVFGVSRPEGRRA